MVVAVADEPSGPVDTARWEGDLRSAGATEVHVVVPDDDRPLTPADVAGAAGVHVAGGLTPRYRRLLVDEAQAGWLPADVPFAGFSAGAAIAAGAAIVGGRRHEGVEIAPEDAAEDLDELTVGQGLALVPFAIDVHCTQWGTLPRLIQAVRAGLAPSGWGIDEHTCLEVVDGAPRAVHGPGSAYGVMPVGSGVAVTVRRA